MKKKTIKLTEKELCSLIKKSTLKVFEDIKKKDKLLLIPLDEDFYSTFIYEGLSVSYPSDKVISYIQKTFNLADNIDDYLENTAKYNGSIGLFNGKNSTHSIIVVLRKELKTIQEQLLNSMENLCGWQLSCVINDTNLAENYPTWFIDHHNILQFEKKFDNDATEVVFKQRHIYHVCQKSKLERIKHIGLTPRDSMWKDFKHKNRVYFFLDKPNMNNIQNEFQNKNIIDRDFVLLEIDTDKINKNTKFFYDPRKEDAVFSTSNIAPIAIAIMSK